MPDFENVVDDNELDVGAEPEVEDNGLSGEEELIKALQSLNSEDDESEDDDNDDIIENEDEEADNEKLDEDSDEEDELEEEETPEVPVKKSQSKEENAKFAAQRREQQLQAKVQEELQRLKEQSPEFLLAKQLSETYGVPPEELLSQMKEQQLIKEAETKGVPVEMLRERQAEKERLQTLEQEISQMRYQQWQSKIEADGVELQKQYTMLNQEDMDEAVNYILTVAGNVDMPLEQAVYAIHGKKIIEGLAQAKTQDKLAAESGRKKKTPLAPNNGKPSIKTELSADEKYIAKQMGLSYDEYLKYK